ncbi:MAG: hypothetical protein NVSMB7_16210 [Chitinophagaceae bacterium]
MEQLFFIPAAFIIGFLLAGQIKKTPAADTKEKEAALELYKTKATTQEMDNE